MGGTQSNLDDDVAREFASRTFFTSEEIHNIYTRWESMGGNMVTIVPCPIVVRMKEIRNNPFRYRICEVFGHRVDKEGMNEVKRSAYQPENPVTPQEVEVVRVAYGITITDWEMNFSEFVNMLNAFSPRASSSVKSYWAFQIYDFDGDKFITTDDVIKVLKTTVGPTEMTRERLHRIAGEVLEEADLDGNARLSRTEFNRVIKRVPDFTSKFQFEILD